MEGAEREMNLNGRLVLRIVMLLSLVTLMGCGQEYKDAGEKMTRYLNDKYGEEFVIENVGGGYGSGVFSTDTIKAEAYPKHSPRHRFRAEISKDFSKVWDNYMNMIMADKFDAKMMKVSQEVFEQKDVWVKSYLNSGGLAFPARDLNNKNMSIEDYFKAEQLYGIAIDVFIKSEPDIDKEREAEKVDQLVAKIVELQEFKNGAIDVYYLKPSSFERVSTDFFTVKVPIDYYRQKEVSYAHTFAEISDGKKKYTVKEILSHFDRGSTNS
ncbi:hypothetical protein NLX71_22585 [Paenibacillus sp. MZ04-78.2]|uniref:hypothetical protein n=1 Tax=Paenibacillus sp. MZ04-78.2 TaxID=2962034 RepID=UPI0020B8D46A|nr:hypothetical protein [Paenibacillus sp. MZ04-78.2]MCP3776053.1 hypothetical protein [Paenibacillus sp. MZ04-78.2]